MNVIMHGRKTLLEQYASQYFSDIDKIEEQRENIDFRKPIKNLGNYNYPKCKTDPHILQILFMHFKYQKKLLEIDTISGEKLLEILNDVIKNNKYTDEELYHIYCCQNDEYELTNPIFDIALKRLFFYLYNTTDVNQILAEIKKEFGKSDSADYLKKVDSIISMKFESKRDVEATIYNKQIQNFNKKMNCAGFAFELYDWLELDDYCDPDITVSRILQNPSVRLLGDTKLQDDEYLVVFNPKVYHFIKQNYDVAQEKSEIPDLSKYEFIEKLGRIHAGGFKGWVSYSGVDVQSLVYFAVKKNHDMNYKYPTIGEENKPMTFSGLFEKTVKDGQTDTFEYHSRKYAIKKVREGEYNITSNGETVAIARKKTYIDDDFKDYNVEVINKFINYVKNTRSEYYEKKYGHILDKYTDIDSYYTSMEEDIVTKMQLSTEADRDDRN